MSVLCPACRHVVDDNGMKRGRCNNCHALIPKPHAQLDNHGRPKATQPVNTDEPENSISSAGQNETDRQPETTQSNPPDQQPTGQNVEDPSTRGSSDALHNNTHKTPPTKTPHAKPDAGPHITPHPANTRNKHGKTFDPAATTCLICASLFFVPFVSQTIGLVAGTISVFRLRRQRKTMTAAPIIGMILCLAALVGWTAILQSVWSAPMPAFTPRAMPANPQQEDESVAAKVVNDAHLMTRIALAASAYKRDFGRWPQSISELTSTILPPEIELPDTVRFIVVDPHESRLDTTLLIRQPAMWDAEGKKLDQPHQLVQPIVGNLRCEAVDATPP